MVYTYAWPHYYVISISLKKNQTYSRSKWKLGWKKKETLATEAEIDDPNLMASAELTYSQKWKTITGYWFKNEKQSLDIDKGRKGIEGLQPRGYSHIYYRKYMYILKRVPYRSTAWTQNSMYRPDILHYLCLHQANVPYRPPTANIKHVNAYVLYI